ncbi:MAG: hypothetical protein GY947_06770 [Rhodobacteraceae bacterium]|nr:hypothetical protein [Paracoccaceae bacterium]
MASETSTDLATSTLIDNSDILEAFVYQNTTHTGGTPGFSMWDSTILTYTLNIGDDNPDGETNGVWTAELTAAILNAQADLAAVSGLTFTEVADTNNGTDGADIDYWYINNVGGGYSGYSYTVGGSGVYINENSVYSPAADGVNGLEYGGINYRTVIHELLHNVGVSHPHSSYDVLPGVTNSGDTGDDALNQNLYTVMSYNRVQQFDANGEQTTGWPWSVTSDVDHSFGVLGAFDIAIVQMLYGANMTTATGNNIYNIVGVNATGTYYKAIWDAGGIDEFRYTGLDDVRIDLRAATLNTADGMLAGGIASKVAGIYGGFTIANGTIIENATGGYGDDLLVGNQVANVIKGKGGRDFIDAGRGKDVIYGGGAKDIIKAGAAKDTIDGGGGNDIIRGQTGDDTMSGGTGKDRFLFKTGDGTGNTITDFEDGIDLIKIITGATGFGGVTVTDSGVDTIVSFSNVSILLQNVDHTDITASDFLF